MPSLMTRSTIIQTNFKTTDVSQVLLNSNISEDAAKKQINDAVIMKSIVIAF